MEAARGRTRLRRQCRGTRGVGWKVREDLGGGGGRSHGDRPGRIAATQPVVESIDGGSARIAGVCFPHDGLRGVRACYELRGVFMGFVTFAKAERCRYCEIIKQMVWCEQLAVPADSTCPGASEIPFPT